MRTHRLYVHRIDGDLVNVTTPGGPNRSLVGRSRVSASNNEVDIAFDSDERWRYGDPVDVTFERVEEASA